MAMPMNTRCDCEAEFCNHKAGACPSTTPLRKVEAYGIKYTICEACFGIADAEGVEMHPCCPHCSAYLSEGDCPNVDCRSHYLEFKDLIGGK